MNLKDRCPDEKEYEKLLDKLAKDITEYDFSDVPADGTSEACYNLAKDLYHADDEEATKIVKIIMDKYVQLIE